MIRNSRDRNSSSRSFNISHTLNDIVAILESYGDIDYTAVISSLLNLLESYDVVTLQEVIDRNVISNLFSVFQSQSSDTYLDFFDLIILIYQLSTHDQRSYLCDLGIHSQLVSLINEVDEQIVPQLLFTLSSMCLTDHDEQDALSNNEIWPTLEQELSTYDNNIDIMKFTSILIVTLIQPVNSVQGDVSRVVTVLESILPILDSQLDILCESENHDASIIVTNYLRVLIAITEMTTDETDFYEIALDPYAESIITIVIRALASSASLFALKAIANLAVMSLHACSTMLDFGLLQALETFLSVSGDRTFEKIPVEFTRWMVIFVLSNIAAGGEANVKAILESSVFTMITDLMKDKSRNLGLFTEYVYFVSNMIFSATVEQKQVIADKGCISALLGFISCSHNDEVNNIASMAISLLDNNHVHYNETDIMSIENPEYNAATIKFDVFAGVPLNG